MNWNGKKVWIIGASSGIGAALAKSINALGGFVVMSARNSSSLEAIQRDLKNTQNSYIIPLDLTDSASIESAIVTYNNEIKTIDVVIHSGGISQRSLALDTTIETSRKIFESNFIGQIPITQFAAQKMIAQKSGKIIVITSFTGKWGFYLRSSYAASKHALHGYYDSLRMEIEKDGIQVHLITPGFIATDISKHALDGDGSATGEMDNNQLQGIAPEECSKQILKGISQGKNEFGVGGKELKALWLNQYFPNFFQKLLRKQSAR